ncbi:unnamed protein product, partial [marine sediment metagenome]
ELVLGPYAVSEDEVEVGVGARGPIDPVDDCQT